MIFSFISLAFKFTVVNRAYNNINNDTYKTEGTQIIFLINAND